MSAASAAQGARLDSGAEAILLRQSTADTHRLHVSSGANTTVIIGNGHTTDTNMQTTIESFPAIVCKDRDLQEDLISLNPLMELKVAKENGNVVES